MWEIRVEMRGTGGGNEVNKDEILCKGVELMNYNCVEGQETTNKLYVSCIA